MEFVVKANSNRLMAVRVRAGQGHAQDLGHAGP